MISHLLHTPAKEHLLHPSLFVAIDMQAKMWSDPRKLCVIEVSYLYCLWSSGCHGKSCSTSFLSETMTIVLLYNLILKTSHIYKH